MNLNKNNNLIGQYMHYKNIAYTTLNSPNNSTSKKLIFDASIQFYFYIIVLMSNKTIVTV